MSAWFSAHFVGLILAYSVLSAVSLALVRGPIHGAQFVYDGDTRHGLLLLPAIKVTTCPYSNSLKKKKKKGMQTIWAYFDTLFLLLQSARMPQSQSWPVDLQHHSLKDIGF